MKLWKNFFSIFIFAFRKHWLTITLVIIIGLSVSAYVRPFGEERVDWWNWAEPISGTVTLLVAVFLWITNVAKDWENNLPKRLSATFLYKNRKVMQFENVYLAGEADIRAWSQQVGRQMGGGKNLNFSPLIKREQPKIKKEVTEDEDVKRVKSYSVMIELDSLPNEYLRTYIKNTELSNDKKYDLLLEEDPLSEKNDLTDDEKEIKKKNTEERKKLYNIVENHFLQNSSSGYIHWKRSCDGELKKERWKVDSKG